MNASASQTAIRNTTNYIAGTVHYNKRPDKKFEILGLLPQYEVTRLGLHIGGEVVLDIAENRNDALASVRFFRGHQNTKAAH